MTYEPIAGDYGVVKTGGIFGKIIRIGTMSRWNHALIYIGDGKIVEANPRGVAISTVDKYTKIAWNMHEELSDDHRQTIVDHAKSTVGRPYNFGIIAMLALRALGLKVFPLCFIHYLADHQGYICSELVAECYAMAKHPVALNQDLSNPGDLAERLIWQ